MKQKILNTMPFITIVMAFVLVSVVVLRPADPTTTYSRILSTSKYGLDKTAWTSTTGVDSVLILNSDGRPVPLHELPEGSRMLSIQTETPDTATATNVSKIIVWFVSNQQNPTNSVSTPATFIGDWAEAKRDTAANTRTTISYFDISTYSAAWVCAIIYEPTETDYAQSEAAYFYYPKRDNEKGDGFF